MIDCPRRLFLPIVIIGALALGACTESRIAVHAVKTVSQRVAPSAPPPTLAPKTAIERGGVRKIGKPYEIAGVWYYPKEDPDYDETGIASWYGKPFHGQSTAIGDIYDMNKLTAAHKTLPMPTDVRVTNLENGRSLRLQVNDRGPFVHGRIIDVSRRAAQLLGFQQAGTARVRVQIVGSGGGGFIAAKPVTPEVERTAIAAVPREQVNSARLAPPPGTVAAPEPASASSSLSRTASAQPTSAPAPNAEAKVTIVPVRPTQLFVQAGAFSFYDNARRLGAKLSAIGPAAITTANVDGKRYYRLRLGPLETLETADSTLEQVIRNGVPGARIVVD